MPENYWELTDEGPQKPKNSKELNSEIKDAVLAIRQNLNMIDHEDTVWVSVNIDWLEELIKLSDIEMKK